MRSAIHMKDVAQDMTLTIKVEGVNEFKLRTHIAICLIQLAAKIIWVKVKIEVDK